MQQPFIPPSSEHSAALQMAMALADVCLYAAEQHRNQRRKDKHASPYINHPLELLHTLTHVGRIRAGARPSRANMNCA